MPRSRLISSSDADFIKDISSECTAQSVVRAMDKFLVAMQEMNRVVMIPSRLKDIPTLSDNNNQTVAKPSETPSLFEFYRMLQMVQVELVSGTPESIRQQSTVEKEEESDPAEQIATAFRQHLQGLIVTLTELTQVAHLLSKRYQEQL